MNFEEAKDEFCIALIPYLPILGKVSNDLIEAADHHLEGYREMGRQLAAKDEEIARLREALEKIEKMPWENSQSPYALIARKALKDKS